MTLGTNNKKQVYILAGLILFAGYMFYTNVLAGPSIPASSRRAAAPAAAPADASAPMASPGPPPARRALNSRGEQFHPVYLDRNPKNRPDPTGIDPTLKLALLSKVQGVDLAGGARNLFQFSTEPPKETPKLAAADEPRVEVYAWKGPKQPPPPGPPPPKPPPPPITLKFYGFSTSADNGKRTAYLLDGEDIFLASEGDTLKRRYKIVRIGPSAIVIEDLDAKREQSVPLTPEGQA